jgi:hypothetical protein
LRYRRGVVPLSPLVTALDAVHAPRLRHCPRRPVALGCWLVGGSAKCAFGEWWCSAPRWAVAHRVQSGAIFHLAGSFVILLEVKDLQIPPLKVNQYEKSIDGIRPIGNPRANYWIRPSATLALSRLLRWHNLHRLQSRQQPVSVDLYLSRRQLGPVFSLRSPFWSRGLPAADSLTRKPGTGTASRIASLHPRGDTGRADDACADRGHEGAEPPRRARVQSRSQRKLERDE